MPRLVGKQGAVYMTSDATGQKIADIFDIVLEVTQELLDATIKFEVHDVSAAGGVSSRLTCQRYITDTTTARPSGANSVWVGGSVMGGEIVLNAPASGNSYRGVTLLWSFETIAGTNNKGFVVSGEGFLERVTLNNPRGMASEVWEIRNTTMPTVSS